MNMTGARQRQLDILNKGLNVEERGVEMYTKYLSERKLWDLMSEETVSGVKIKLGILAQESKQHIVLVEKIIQLFKILNPHV